MIKKPIWLKLNWNFITQWIFKIVFTPKYNSTKQVQSTRALDKYNVQKYKTSTMYKSARQVQCTIAQDKYNV